MQAWSATPLIASNRCIKRSVLRRRKAVADTHEAALGAEQRSLRRRLINAIHELTGRYRYGLGEWYRGRSQLDEAVAAFEAAEHWEAAHMGPTHPYVVAAIIARAATLAQMGRTEEACRQYSRALHLIEETVGGDHPKAKQIERYLNVNCG
jgi:tetratricopeptide (TPR) repeat protein